MKAIFLCFAIVVLVCSVKESQAQVSISEDNLSIDVLKWHYTRYPNSQNNAWSTTPGGFEVQVSFEFNGSLITALYDGKGKIKAETVDLTSAVPISLITELDDEFADNKYKVVRFTKTTSFINSEKIYEIEIKSKLRGVENRKYDSDLIPLAIGDYSASVSTNN